MMTTKVDEPEGEEEIAGRLEQLRTLITDRFSSTERQVSSTQKKVKAFGFSGEKSSTLLQPIHFKHPHDMNHVT